MRWARGAIAGLLSAAVAVGVGELIAWLVRPVAAPVVAVGNRVVDLTPESVRLWAIRNFGSNDKHVLLTGIYVVLVLAAAGIGVLAWRWFIVGVLGIAAAGGFAIYCAASAHGAHGSDVVPSILGTASALGVLFFLHDQHSRTVPEGPPDSVDHEDGGLERRSFLTRAAWVGGGAVAGGLAGRGLQHARFDVSAARAGVVLPTPSGSAAATSIPPGADLGVSGTPWATPNKDFYRVDTALYVPQVSPSDWKLRIHGMVDREVEITYDQLKARPLIERWVTLNCVSNGVGGDLIGNALWLGTLLAPLLNEAGIHPDADQLLMSSADAMTIGAPTAPLLDGRDAMLAIGMNGQPLPQAHGFPVRAIVPGLYGYISACKWITDIEATTFANKAYWVTEGWEPHPELQLASRIDTPRIGKKVKAGVRIPIAGVAWDQHVGISKVEVQIGKGAWEAATLATVQSTDTWRQWVYYWTPPQPGSYLLTVRATDAAGRLQVDEFAAPFPSGATGLHNILVQAT
ncbi:MAG TPA: molybdopterin-dependent oxidoreductase [Jatrophihabitans sp.]